MFRAKLKKQIVLEAINTLANNSSITQLSPGGKARAIIEAVGQIVGNVSADTSDGIMQTLLTDASGATLDLIAESYGIQRLTAVAPKVESRDSSLRYYVRRGTFGDLNNGADITIPKGTQIRSDTSNASIYLIQRENLVLSGAGNTAYFAADQVGTSAGLTVAPNTLTRHNFVGYTNAAFRGLLVTNDKGVAGRPPESDANLRFRIRSQITSSSTANASSIRIAALSVPGVADARILENRAGLGTFDVVVYGISPSVPVSVIQAVQSRIDQVTALGCRGIAVSPRLVGVSVATSIKFRANTPQSDKNAIITDIDTAIRDYITNLLPGQELVINSLVQRILGTSSQILDIGTPGNPLLELFVWRQNGPNSRRYSRKLELNYRIQDDEDLVVEPFIENPISIIEG
jgi:uncharacterized phage protein gp47/JayE